jgi:tetratricopeptide (TPR) repeat protein
MKCIDMRPDSFYLYQELLDLYVLTDNFNKAEDLYMNILLKFESDSLLNMLSSSLATAYSTSKEYDKALMFYRKMLEQDTSLVFIRYQIANTYQLKNEKKKAVTEYKKLLRIDPNYVEAYVQLGKLYYDDGNYEKAKQYLEKAYEYTLNGEYYASDYSSIFFYRGMIAAKEGREFDAMLSYLELKSSYDYSGTAKDKKIQLYNEIRKFEE